MAYANIGERGDNDGVVHRKPTSTAGNKPRSMTERNVGPGDRITAPDRHLRACPRTGPDGRVIRAAVSESNIIRPSRRVILHGVCTLLTFGLCGCGSAR
jgi:hypothetical protein